MDAERAAEQLKGIRELMERPVKYSTQSGVASIIAGCAAIAGVVMDRVLWGQANSDEQAIAYSMFVWLGVLVVSMSGVLVLTRIRERRRGMPRWSQVKFRILRAILPPFLAGGGLTCAIVLMWWRVENAPQSPFPVIVFVSQGYLIPAIWMLFYGVACWQVGEFSVVEIRVLGAAFVAAGIATAVFFQGWPYLALGVTFGGFHIAYGVAVWVRHGG